MPTPRATWNPARGVWETTTVALCGHSELYSVTWPTSGTTRSGVAYELPTWAPLTDGSASSSPPGLLPTPRATDGTKGGPGQTATQGGPSLPAVAALLPTPTASDRFGAGQHGDGGQDLRTTIALLPTPTAMDSKGARNATSGRKAGSQHHSGETLLDVFWTPPAGSEPPLLPTPRAMANSKSTRAMTASRENGRRSGGGQSSPPGLDEIALLATGHRPPHLPVDEELPEATRRLVQSLGATTPPPSDAGS